MTESWPVVTVRVPEGTSLEAWEIFCALACEEAKEGYIESGSLASGAPMSADFAFPQAEGNGDAALAAAREYMHTLAAEYLPGPGLQVTARLVQDEKWTERWREFYFPTLITPRLVVGPPDGKMPPETGPDAIYLKIELGSAFGTGGHATTKGSLVMLERFLPRDASLLLDMGTGTGVLSFAAVRLGCARALGMDADHHAEPNFRWNAKLNGVEDRALFVLGRTVEEALAAVAERGLGKPTLITCNMISRDFDPLLAGMRAIGAPMILSGFLEEETEAVERRLGETGWRAGERLWIDDWGTWMVE